MHAKSSAYWALERTLCNYYSDLDSAIIPSLSPSTTIPSTSQTSHPRKHIHYGTTCYIYCALGGYYATEVYIIQEIQESTVR